MLTILSITLPIFAAVALGYVTVRGGLFKPSDMRLFGSFVLNIALPALLFNAVATRDVSEVFNFTYMAVFGLGALLTIIAAYVIFTLLGTSPTRRAVGVMGATCPNSGFVGYPLMLLTFPEFAEQILALNLLIENFVIIPTSLVLFELTKTNRQQSVLRLLGSIAYGVLRRPMVIALVLGLIVSLLKLPLPEPLTRTVGIFAASASAIALFSIGGALVGLPFNGNRAMAAVTAASKLLLHPAMAAFALLLVPLFGFAPLDKELAVAVVLSCAVPMFAVYGLFASELGHEGMASIAQLLATALSFITLSTLMLLLL